MDIDLENAVLTVEVKDSNSNKIVLPTPQVCSPDSLKRGIHKRNDEKFSKNNHKLYTFSCEEHETNGFGKCLQYLSRYNKEVYIKSGNYQVKLYLLNDQI